MVRNQNMHSFPCVVFLDDLIKNECYFDYLGVLVIVLDINGIIKVFNKKAENLTGYTKSEVLGKKWISKLIPKKIRASTTDTFAGLIAGDVDKIEDYINPIVAKDGKEIVISWSNKLILSSSAKLQGVISTGTDITKLINTESEIVKTKDYYSKIIDDLPNPIWRADTTSKCDFFNKAWLAFTGRKMQDELGDGWANGVHEDDLERCVKIYKYSFAKRIAFYMEYRLMFNDGTYHWLADYGQPLFDKENVFLGYIGSCYDINTVKNMTDEERSRNKDLEKMNSLMIGRELKMMELKNTILELERKLDEK